MAVHREAHRVRCCLRYKNVGTREIEFGKCVGHAEPLLAILIDTIHVEEGKAL